jgi:flagellar hook-associated protein 3 FlgL
MRITNNSLQRDALARMQLSMQELARAHRRAVSGLRLERASDDPGAVGTAMQTRGELRALTQYRANVKSASSRITAEESVLDQITTVLTRAKELATAQGGDSATAATRQTAVAELDEMIKHIVQLGNTQIAGDYLFGGADPQSAPIVEDPNTPGRYIVRAELPPADAEDPDASAPVAAAPPRVEVGAGQYVQPVQEAASIFGASGANVLKALTDLRDALASNDGEAVRSAALPQLDASFQAVQTRLAETGARSNYLQVTLSNLDALDGNLQTFKSDLEELDFETAVTELVSRQTAYQAAMMATSRVIGMTITDYLR